MILGHLSVRALKQMNPEDRMRTVAREIAKMEPRKRKRVAEALFGKAGARQLLAMVDR